RSLPRRAISSGVAAACTRLAVISAWVVMMARAIGLIMCIAITPSEGVFDVEGQLVAVSHQAPLVDIRRGQVVDPGAADLEVAQVGKVRDQGQGFLAAAQALVGPAAEVLLTGGAQTT